MVNKFKVTFIWSKTFLEVFDYDKCKDSEYAYRDYCSFKEILDGIGLKKKTDYSYPWHELQHNNFWNQYLKCRDEKKLDTSALWESLVPLFHNNKTKICFNSEKYGTMKVTLEPYMYHHGLSIALNVNIKSTDECIRFENIAEVTGELYNLNKYELYDNGIYKEDISLKELYKTLVGRFAKEIVYEVPKSDSFPKPFTIITIMEGEQDELSKDGLLQNVRNIFNIVDQTYKEVIPISKNKDTEDVYNKNLMFCSKRGRIIWYPAMFLRTPGKKKSLGCYNKNIMRLSMHIESLMDLLKEFMSSNPSSDYLYTYAGNSQHQIVKLYNLINSNLKTTYYSASAVAHINHNDYLGLINLVRDKLNISRKVDPIQMKDIFVKELAHEDNLFF